MCGLCGAVRFNKDSQGLRDLVHGMMDCLAHRGPDEEGLYLDETRGVCLGHRRLSIIDLASGQQPMCNAAKTIYIVFNGEIYNYPELKAELQEKGLRFQTNSDTEVIINLYEAYGERAFARLNGIFAFAIYDKTKDLIVLARDHFGVKPLYYYQNANKLLFGSEIKAILRDPSVERLIDFEGFNTFFTFRYSPSPQTLIKGIRKLEPGHYLKVSLNGVSSLESYWDYTPRTDETIREAEAIEEYQRLLEQAVRRQMISDVPVGLLLSGGMDSAVIGHLMQRNTDKRIKSFTIGFPGKGRYNELDDARRTAEFIDSDHYDMTINRTEYLNGFIRSFHYTEEPTAESTIPALYYVSKLAAHQLKVVLSGQGADEPLAGYHRYIGEKYLSAFAPLLNNGLARAAIGLLPRNERLKRAVFASQFSSEASRFLGIYTLFTPSQKARLFNRDIQTQITDGADLRIVQKLDAGAADLTDSLSRLMYVDTRLSLSDNLLLFGDKMTMANSLECRVPFLDVDLVKFLESLPSWLKLKGFTRKYIHKKACHKWLPNEIIYRKKRGFETPVDAWLQSGFATNAMELFGQSDSACRRYFNLEFISELIQLHRSKRENHQRQIFALLCFELWHKIFFENRTVDYDVLTHEFENAA